MTTRIGVASISPAANRTDAILTLNVDFGWPDPQIDLPREIFDDLLAKGFKYYSRGRVYSYKCMILETVVPPDLFPDFCEGRFAPDLPEKFVNGYTEEYRAVDQVLRAVYITKNIAPEGYHFGVVEAESWQKSRLEKLLHWLFKSWVQLWDAPAKKVLGVLGCQP